MSKMTAQGSSQTRLFKPKIYHNKGEDNLEIIMIMIDIKIDRDQTVEIGECHIEVELSIDKTIEEGHSMVITTEVTLGKKILEECKIIEVRILEVDIKVILGMPTLEEVEVGLEKDSIPVILEEMSKVVAVVVGPDQVQEQVLIEIGFDILNVGSVIISPKTA